MPECPCWLPRPSFESGSSSARAGKGTGVRQPTSLLCRVPSAPAYVLLLPVELPFTQGSPAYGMPDCRMLRTTSRFEPTKKRPRRRSGSAGRRRKPQRRQQRRRRQKRGRRQKRQTGVALSLSTVPL